MSNSFSAKIKRLEDEIYNLKIEKLKASSVLKTTRKDFSLSFHIKFNYLYGYLYPQKIVKVTCVPSHGKNMVGMASKRTLDGRIYEFLPVDDGTNLTFYIFPTMFTYRDDYDHFDQQTGVFTEFDISGTFSITATDEFSYTTEQIDYPYNLSGTFNLENPDDEEGGETPPPPGDNGDGEGGESGE